MRIWVDAGAWAELRALPGHMRPPIRQAIQALARNPRPSRSQTLDLPPEVATRCPAGVELRRLRLGQWRVIYAIDDEWETITIVAIRRRPPYQYQDLAELIARL